MPEVCTDNMKAVPVGVRDVYLSLGTNIGDRKKNLDTARRMLEGSFGCRCKAESSVIETRSWGFEGADFLNCVLCFCLSLQPHEILRVCKDIERSMGRMEQLEYGADGRRIYHDRIIDIDILLCGDERVDEPDLTIPHPHMRDRDFVMIPLMEILDEKH